MKLNVWFCAASLSALLCISPALRAGDDVKSASSAPKSTVVPLLQNSNNVVQLGARIDGQFSYPFTFASDPPPANGLKLSAAGVVSGTPSETGDQALRIVITDSDGKLVASYPVVLHVTNAITVILGPADKPTTPPADDPPPVTATTKLVVNPVYEHGDTVTGNSGAANSVVAVTCKSSGAIEQSPKKESKGENEDTQKCNDVGTARATSDDRGLFSYRFATPLNAEDLVSVSSASGDRQDVPVQPAPKVIGEDMRAIVGYQQAGASSSDFEQNWFVDLFISRPLGFQPKHEGKDVAWRWWGNVRVASFPQPGNQSVAELASDLPAQIGALKLNQLAQGAEFLSGVEFKPWRSFPFRGFSENTRQVFTLGLIAGAGATGFFGSPSTNVKVFQVPPAGSPQLASFQQAFPSVKTANVGFISPDIERFPKQYLAGIRLTTHYVDPTGMPLATAPAMLAFSLGQNQTVTGGKLTGVVGRVEAFYPLPFGNRGQSIAGAFSSLYLFGTAQMRLGGTQTAPALALKPATVDATDPSVTLAPLPNTRDEYRLGFGIDLVDLVSALTGGSAKKAATALAKPKDSSTPSPSGTGGSSVKP